MDALAGRRIALIGGAGFVGHHLALGLRQAGAEVHVIDSLAVNNYYSLMARAGTNDHAGLSLRMIQQRLRLFERQDVGLHVVDARDYQLLSRILGLLDVDTIVHLAAVAHAGRSNKDPHSTFDHSLRTLENALDVTRAPRLNIRHFVYLSSSMVYGDFAGGEVDETRHCEPIGIYGALKYAGEKLVIAYQQVFDVPYTIVRPSALYGERCISRRVTQVFLENALQDRPLSINGDGSERLDFTYIDDLVHGIMQVLVHDGARNQIFNLTYGAARSVRDLVDLVAGHFPGLRVQHAPRDRLMPQRGTLAVDKARQLIDYAPRYDLQAGLQRYVEWYRSMWSAPAEPGSPLLDLAPAPLI